MYDTILQLHSWLRWFVLVAGLFAIVKAIGGRSSGHWTSGDNRAGAIFVGMLDLQLLVGLLLYFGLSPIVKEGMRDIGATMANPALRFFTVEHPFGMLLGLVLAHIGRARTKKLADPARKHRTALIFFTLALVIIMASVPWPGHGTFGRPLFR